MPSVQDVQNNLIGIRNQFKTQGEGSEQGALQAMANYVRENGLDPVLVGQAANNIGQTPWDATRVQQTLAQYSGKQPADAYGLRASNNTLAQGASDATARINQTQSQVGDIYKQGLQMLNPYMQAGGQANDLQAALSGALGPEAQKQAYANYQSSPGVQFAQQEAERALLRNASATGGLGGGNVLRDLTQLAAGTAMQGYNTQFQQLGEVANRGYGAATTGAGLQGQQAGVQAGLGQFAANIPLQTASQQAGMQFQGGRDIASAISNTTSALSNLINQQGAGMTDITGNTTNNINSLYQNALNGDANSKEQLAAILANLSANAGSQVGGLPMIQPGQTNYLGQVGQIAGGIGGIASAYSYMNQGNGASGVNSTANTNPGYGPSYTGSYNYGY